MKIVNFVVSAGVGLAVLAFLALLVLTSPTAQAAQACPEIGRLTTLTSNLEPAYGHNQAIVSSPSRFVAKQLWVYERSDETGSNFVEVARATGPAPTFIDRTYAAPGVEYRVYSVSSPAAPCTSAGTPRVFDPSHGFTPVMTIYRF